MLSLVVPLVLLPSSAQSKQTHQLRTQASNDPLDSALKDGLKGNRIDVRVVGSSSHRPEEHVAKHATIWSTPTVSGIREQGPLFNFAWSFAKVFLGGGPITEGIGNVPGWGCTIAGFLTDRVPSWTVWPCGAIGVISAITNVYQGQGLWMLLGPHFSSLAPLRMTWEVTIHGIQLWSRDTSSGKFAIGARTSGQLIRVHFCQLDSTGGLAILPLQALMGANKTDAIPFADSIYGTLTYLGAKILLESNGAHTGFVSVGLPAHLVSGVASERDDPATVDGILYVDDYNAIEGQGSTEYGGYHGIYYGDYHYGIEDQFWELGNEVGGEALDSNGAVYVGVEISTRMVEESATYGRVCMQTGSCCDWVSTGTVQLGTGPNSWKGYSRCWNAAVIPDTFHDKMCKDAEVF